MTKSKGYRLPDPVTSQIVIDRMIRSGVLGERQAQVHRIVVLYPGYTAGEYSEVMVQEYPQLPLPVAVETPHKRLKELESKGFVRRGEIRTCRVRKTSQLTWFPTDLGKKAIK